MIKKVIALLLMFIFLIFSMGCQTAEQQEAKLQMKDEQYVLRQLRNKYGEEFVIAGYDPGGLWTNPGGPSFSVYPKEKGENWTFKVYVYERYKHIEDGYMILYKYDDYKKYIQSFLEEMYAKNITLASFKKDGDNLLPNIINKDTPVEDIARLVIEDKDYVDMGPIVINLNEEVLKGTTISKEAYRIAKAFQDRRITAVYIYISVVRSSEYEYNRDLLQYYSPLMDTEERMELNKKFFSFFSKYDPIYDDPLYSIGASYDRDEKKFRIFDSELKIEYWEE